MFTISSDALLGKITISDTFSSNQPAFYKSGDVYTLSFINLKNVKYFKTFKYSSTGHTQHRYLITEYRISKDSSAWTPWLKLENNINNFPPFDSKYTMYIDIRWIRKGESVSGIINLSGFELQGSLDKPTVFLTTDNISANTTTTNYENYSYPNNSQNINLSKNETIFIGVSGPQGPIGPQGTGPQGSTGSKGLTGPQGPDGISITGPQGFTGDIGPQGEQGNIGPQGLTGPRGFQGDIGFQGDRGFQGFQGLTGPQGFFGPTGSQGYIGATGPQGFIGSTGPQGLNGINGATGPQGLNGIDGATGPQGFTGATGPQGPAGLSASFSGLTTSYPIMGNGVSTQLSLGYSSDFDLDVSNNLELALTFTSLPSLSIVNLWSVRKSDNVTQFPNTTIGGSLISGTSTAASITVPVGSIVYYGGTATIGAVSTGIQAPSNVTGNWVFSPNPPITYPKSSYFSASNIVVTTVYSISETKPKAGLIVSGSQVIRATGNDSSSTSVSVTFNDLMYYGYINTLGSGTITQATANTISASDIQGLSIYKYGGKAQTLTSVTDSSGFRVVIAYLASYGNLSHIVLNAATDVLGSFYQRATNISISTLSGLTASYIVYVASVDNSYPGSNTLALS